MITRTQLVGVWSLESYTETDVQSGEVSYPMGRDIPYAGLLPHPPCSAGRESARMGARRKPIPSIKH
jgi:hypothetical protein